jgi:hypothetical protein
MYYQNYEDSIKNLPLKESYDKGDLMVKDFLYANEGNIEVYWAPFEYVNNTAKVIILGITPGWTQMELAFNYVRHHINDQEVEQLLRHAKNNASFGGTAMRKNLIEMLDGIELNRFLKIASCEQLFNDQAGLLHTTSVLRYPVFIDKNNYTGSNPKILKEKVFTSMMEELLIPELNEVKDAVIIPTGKAVSDVLRYLVKENKLRNRTILFDFPHPSGANGHRKKQYEKNKELFKQQLGHAEPV